MPAKQRLLKEAIVDQPANIWEIGPGIGTLTSSLSDASRSLVLFEIDLGFVRLLEELFLGHDHVRIVEGDFIDTWGAIAETTGFPDTIVGNLPYNAAAKIILEMFQANAESKIVITVQKEMADRMSAKIGTSDYSSFSIICQTGWNIRSIGTLRPGSFYPRPHVDSEMLVLEYRSTRMECDRSFFLNFCRCLFASRRKTIRNNIAQCDFVNEIAKADRFEIIESLGVPLSARGEELSAESVVGIADAFSHAILSNRPSMRSQPE
jgi:16S rRNA (adenine1518-N6/adenine1519-N6)-dimethyltransferase